MSFNLLKYKKNNSVEIKNQEISIDYLIVGFDTKTVFDLTQEENFTQIKFMILDQSERTIEENIKLADQIPYPWIFDSVDETKLSHSSATFFKDGEFRSFQGRHKINNCHPFLLKYSQIRYCSSWLNWWNNGLDQDVKNSINQSLKIGQVKSISFKDEQWELSTFDHKIIKVKKLKWNLSPEQFLKLFHFESSYPKNFLTWCSNFSPLNFLLLQVKADQALYDKVQTSLIPLTMGTDEGYFLLTKDLNNNDECLLNMLYVFDEPDFQEEDVGNRIKLMKKQMTKIFNAKESLFKEEKVFFLPLFTFINTSMTANVEGFLQNESIFAFDPHYYYIAPSDFSSAYLSTATKLNEMSVEDIHAIDEHP